MEEEISSWTNVGFQQYFGVIVCTLCVLIVASATFNRYFRSKFSELSDANYDTASGLCRFPDCVRCRRHKDVLMRARTKLTYYEDNSSVNAASAAAQLLTDIQTSYRKLTQKSAMDDLGKCDTSAQNPLVFHVRGIRAKPVWHSDDFPGLETLEDNLEHIQREFWDLRQGNMYSTNWKENDTPSGKWSLCHLIDQGVQTNAVAACPVTWRVISRLSVAMTGNLFGNVAFSVVEPGTKIVPHYGPSNIRIRCHLGLQVTAACRLSVGSTSLQWSQGKMICFDETYLHSVQHGGTAHSDGPRVVLILDLWHPDLNMEQRNLIDYAFNSATLS